MKPLHKYIYIGIVVVGFLLISFIVYYRRKIVEQFDAKVNELHITDTTSSPDDKKEMLKLAKLTEQQDADSKFDKTIDQTQLPKV
jgi:hypothetical protein